MGTPLSLTSTLLDASSFCNNKNVVVDSSSVVMDSKKLKNKKRISIVDHGSNTNNRQAEAFASSIQYKLEQCVIANQSDNTNNDNTNQNNNKKRKRNIQKHQLITNNINLVQLASKAFTSFIRAYPTREKAVKHIFSTRALHLGHIAKSFALKDTPRQIVKKHKNNKKK